MIKFLIELRTLPKKSYFKGGKYEEIWKTEKNFRINRDL